MWARHGRTLVSAVGLVLVAASLAVALWWYYVMGPVRRSLDPDWVASHSPQDYWEEIQTAIHRGSWNHDDGFTVGYYGDESWARWIMARVKPGDSMSCAAPLNHSAASMRYITNQNAGEDADGWLAWWQANRDKTQREWIADGFRQRGLRLDVPLRPAQTKALLELLGKPGASGDKDDFLRYNAFRWLRDSGFEAVEYALSGERLSKDVKAGLREYAHREASFPRISGLGELAISPQEPSQAARAAILLPRYQRLFQLLIWGPIVLGVALMCWSLRKAVRPRTAQPIATTAAAG